MATNVVSLDRARIAKHQQQGGFQELFVRAQKMRDIGEMLTESGMALVTEPGMETWFRKGIADEVFRRRFFSRDIISSIGIASEILVWYAHHREGMLGITLTLAQDDTDPSRILDAARTSFVVFSLGPEQRFRRTVRYREVAAGIGPTLFRAYSGMTSRSFGYDMATAFVPIGEIVRHIFYGYGQK